VRFFKVSRQDCNLDALSGMSLPQETSDRINSKGGQIEEIYVPQQSLDSILKQKLNDSNKLILSQLISKVTSLKL
jgi:hypothetical protein